MVMPTTAIDPTRCPVCRAPFPTTSTTCNECQEDLSALVLVDSLPILRYNEALRLVQAGQVEAAIEQLLGALAIDPTLTDARVVLGKLHAQQGRYDAAISAWKQVLTDVPNEPRAVAGIARLEALRHTAMEQDATRARRQRLRFGSIVAAAVLGALLLGGGLAWTGRGAPPRAEVAVTVVTTVVTVMVTPTPGAVVAVTAPAIAPASAAAAPAPAPTADAPRPPDLAAAVRRVLSDDPVLAGLQLDVEQRGSAVALAGRVPSLELRVRAEEMARQVSGVAAVDGGGVQVTPGPIVQRVREALGADARTAALPLDVEAAGPDVRLRGAVTGERLRQLILQLARGVEGVRLIDSSELVVVRPTRFHQVRAGETLYALADRYYGDGSRWRLILEANREQVAEPGQVVTGMRLVIPDDLDQP